MKRILILVIGLTALVGTTVSGSAVDVRLLNNPDVARSINETFSALMFQKAEDGDAQAQGVLGSAWGRGIRTATEEGCTLRNSALFQKENLSLQSFHHRS